MAQASAAVRFQAMSGTDDGGQSLPRLEHLSGDLVRERQRLIREYEVLTRSRLVVLIGYLETFSITLFEDLLIDADPGGDLHLLLDTPGGDGEAAIRLVRQAQSRCRELSVIVPDRAKSAGTILALGAHRIVMGPTSDLGPIDPQFLYSDGRIAAAKAILAAFDRAERQVLEAPETALFHAAMLSDVTALMAQQARDAISRTDSQLREALASHSERGSGEVEVLAKRLAPLLIVDADSHAAVVSGSIAADHGLPIKKLDAADPQWRAIWRLWTRYFALPEDMVYESASASHVFSSLPSD